MDFIGPVIHIHIQSIKLYIVVIQKRIGICVFYRSIIGLLLRRQFTFFKRIIYQFLSPGYGSGSSQHHEE
jgi:hypothetical protein